MDAAERLALKQRAKGRCGRCPPPLTGLLHRHLEQYGVVDDGRLFRSMDGGDVAESTLARVWDKASKAARSRRNTGLRSLAGPTICGTHAFRRGSRVA